MPKRYYIDLSRKELTMVIFPGYELKKVPETESVQDVLIPVLLPVVRRKNKKISEVPITFRLMRSQLTGGSFRRDLLISNAGFPRGYDRKYYQRGIAVAGARRWSLLAKRASQMALSLPARYFEINLSDFTTAKMNLKSITQLD